MKVAVLEGDGIGPEIMQQGLRILNFLIERSNLNIEIIHAPFGAKAYFDHGDSFPKETKKICDDADVILKGPVGLDHEKTKQIPIEMQPERGAILPLRKRYDTYANFRPVFLSSKMSHLSPLKNSVISAGVDFIMIRELVGGLYFGKKSRGINSLGQRFVEESLEYDEYQIRRILKIAFDLASSRKKRLHNIHKSNVLLSSVLWNEILTEIQLEHPTVHVENMLVDAAATALCLDPCQFDVLVMENMFGDILSDQAGGIIGSLGLMPSACIGEQKSYFEPSHGSAPDIAGKNIANPYSMIGSVAMMLDMAMNYKATAAKLWTALHTVLESGYGTPDLRHKESNTTILSTEEFGSRVLDTLSNENWDNELLALNND